MKPFILVSHAASDKNNPEFLRVLHALNDAGVPLGIDRPNNLPEGSIAPELFVWHLRADGNDFGEAINLAEAEACGTIFLASRNTRPDSYVWKEFHSAQTMRHAKGSSAFDFWCLDLDEEAIAVRPTDVRARQFHRSNTELKEIVGQILAHLERVRRTNALGTAMSHLAEQNRFVDVVGTRLMHGEYVHLPLDQIYTALRGDLLSAAERGAAHRAILRRGEGGDALSFEWAQQLDAVYETRRGAIDMNLTASDDVAASIRRGLRLNLATAVSENPVLVILGEPASGKSTLLRWLALRFATAWIEQDGDSGGAVKAAHRHVDPDATDDDEVTIGALKLPILFPMSELAKTLGRGGTPDLLSITAEQLEKLWEGRIAVEDPDKEALRIITELATEGRLLILLDGLDEVGDARTRADAIEIVGAFSERWTAGGASVASGPQDRGNRLVVTSRIVGYSEVRLPNSWPHVIVDRMSEDTVLLFWRRLFSAYGEDDPVRLAAGLHDRVFGDEGGGLEDLAGIPLLAAMLAVTFHLRGGLPDRRIQIYDAVIRHLVVERRPDRSESLTLERWKRWLCVIAKVMLEGGGQGLISESDYNRLLLERHREIDEGGNQTTFEHERVTSEFRKANDARVGLLVERADGRYGFLHRTFQEYLAAAWLMDLPAKAATRVLERWDDPAWREAALLALGHESLRGERQREARDSFFEELFEGTEPSARSRLAHFLAAAVIEMPDAPSGAVATRILVELISGLRGESLENQPDIVRQRLSDAVYALADRNPEIFEASLAQLLATGRADIACALAELVGLERWRTRAIVDALKASLPRDQEARGYPIERALRQALTDIADQLNTPRPRPKKPQRPKLTDEPVEGGTDVRAMIRLLTLRRNHVHRVRRWRVTQHLSRYQRIHPPADVALLADAAESDLGWRAVAAGMLGAFGNRDMIRGTREYRRLAHFLQDPNEAREQLIDDNPSLVRQFGADDTVYSTAVYLDTQGSVLLGKGFGAPVFDQKLAYPIAALPERLLDAAIGGVADPEALHAAAIAEPSIDARMAMLLAACFSNIDGRLPVYALIASLSPEERQRLRSTTARAQVGLEDGAFRALQMLLTEPKRERSFTPEQVLALLLAIDGCARLGKIAPDKFGLHLAHVAPRVLAEFLVFNLAMLSADDPVQGAAVALGEFAKLSVDDVSEVIRLMPEAAGRGWSGDIESTWNIVFPRSKRSGDLPPHAFDVPGTSYFVTQRLPIAAAVQSVALNALERAEASEVKLALAPHLTIVPLELLEVAAPVQTYVVSRIEALTDAYLQCRGFLAIAECGLGEPRNNVARAHHRVAEIQSPLERFIVLERLLTYEVGGIWERTAAAARSAVLAIDDPREGWRACLQLAARDPRSRVPLYKAAATMLNRIADPIERLDHWMAARRAIGCDLMALSDWESPDHADDPGDAISRAASRAFRAPILLQLEKLQEFDADAALVLYCAQVCVDVLDAIEIAERRDDQAASAEGVLPRELLLQATAGASDAVDTLVRSAEKLRPDLTGELAYAIQRIYDHNPGAAERLAVSVKIETGASISLAEPWLQSQSQALAFEAAAAIARRTPRRDRAVVSALLAGVNADNDLRAARACQVLTRGTLSCDRPPRISRASDFGLDGLLELGRFIADARNKAVRVMGMCAVLDVLQDDPVIVRQLCDIADEERGRSAAALCVLAETVADSDAVLEVLGDRLKSGAFATQRAIIDAFAAMTYEFPEEKREHVVDYVHAAASYLKRPIRFLAHGGEDLVQSIEEALAIDSGEETQLNLAKDMLNRRATDLRQAFLDRDQVTSTLLAQYDSRTIFRDQFIPVMHARKSFHALRDRFGSRLVTIVGTWFSDLLLDEDFEEEAFRYLAFAVAELGRANPALLSEAMIARVGGAGVLRRAIMRCIGDPGARTAGASATVIACLTGPIDEAMVSALFEAARWPLPDRFSPIEKSLLELNPIVLADTLPTLVAAVEGTSKRVALIAVRLLGALVRNPKLAPSPRRQGREVLERVIASDWGSALVVIFSPTNKDGDGAPIRVRGTLREAALLELARAEL